MQAEFFAKLRKEYPFYDERFHHIPNGGKRNLLEAVRLKAQGVKKGKLDNFLAYPINGYHGLMIEAKPEIIVGKPKPRVSKEQKQEIDRLRADGYCAEVAYGYNDMMRIFLLYISSDIDCILESSKLRKLKMN